VVVLVAALTASLTGCGDDGGSTVVVPPTSPYYVAAKALSQPQVAAGTKVGGCTITAFTACRGVDLSGQYLQGAFLAYSDLSGADLSGVNLLQADVAFAMLDGIDLTEAKLSATATTKASFVGAHLARS
jgi:hypothetical protein